MPAEGVKLSGILLEDENCNTDCFSGDTRCTGAEGATDAKAF